MRYAAGFFYALAIAAHSGDLVNSIGLGVLVFLGVVCTLFAVEAIVRAAVRPASPADAFPRSARNADALRRESAAMQARDRAPNHEDPPHGH